MDQLAFEKLATCVDAAILRLLREAMEMPPKVRDLVDQLERAGFVNRGGKGSHRNYVHPRVAKPVTISGNLGDDAKRYQVRAVWQALVEVQR